MRRWLIYAAWDVLERKCSVVDACIVCHAFISSKTAGVLSCQTAEEVNPADGPRPVAETCTKQSRR